MTKKESYLKIGDKVYWRYLVGMFFRTGRGEIVKIDGDEAIVKCIPYYNEEKLKIWKLTKNKEQS